MTFLEQQQELSEILAESGTKTYTTAARKRWINMGVIEVCRKTLCLVKEVTKNVVAGDNDYDIIVDWAMTDFVEFADAGIVHKDSVAAPSTRYTPLERKTVEWLDENVPGWRMTDSSLRSDSLRYYARSGMKQVVVWPAPATAVTGGWIIHYHYFPIQGTTYGGLIGETDVPYNAGTTDNTPELVPYHELPVLYAAYRALLKAGSPKATAVLQEFGAQVQNMRAELRIKRDYEPQIRVFNYRAR